MILYGKQITPDLGAVGGKGYGLIKLREYGYNVPDFFIVPTDGMTDGTDFAAELKTFAANLRYERFAVRSSAANEDGAKASFAGQYSTELNVEMKDLLSAVKRVAQSINRENAEKYSRKFEKTDGKMAVIVQGQITGVKSGVMFTSSPLSPDETVIEYVEGLGERLVGGNVTPVKRVFKKNNPVGADELEAKLLAAAEDLERREGRPLDIEWTFDGKDLYFLQMRPLTAIGDKLPEIPERDWELYVYRDFCPFCHGVQRIASTKQTQEKAFGFAVPILEGLIVNGREFYSAENDDYAILNWQSLDNGDFFERFIKDIKSVVAETVKRADELAKSDFDGLSVSRLFEIYNTEIERYIKSYVPLMMRPDDYLEASLIKLIGESGAKTLISALSCGGEKTLYSSEKEEFLKAVIGGNGAGYAAKYEWKNNPLGSELRPLTEKDFIGRANGLTVKGARNELKKLELIHAENARIKREALARIESDEVKRIAYLIEQFVFLRTYTAENSDRYCYYLRKKVLQPLAQKLGISGDVLPLMSPEEFAAAKNGFRLTQEEIRKRKSGELTVISNGESKTYYSGASYSVLKNLTPAATLKDSAYLTGEPACMGVVRGEVKLVNNFLQAESFKKGNILVTSMTTPEISAALDKAAGIITDEGGMTCHAAIIAREYAVPCLVGTKRATAVLKDGMQVELDCVQGAVRIIS